MVVLSGAAPNVTHDAPDVPEQAVIMNYCRPEEQVKQTLVRPPGMHDCTHTGNKSIPAVYRVL